MTELERMLKNALLSLEQNLIATQKTQTTSLTNHQRSLESHAQAIGKLQEKIDQLQVEQQESEKLLHGLCDAYKSLESLLARMNAMLNAK